MRTKVRKCKLCEPEDTMHENPCLCSCHIKGDGKEEPTSQWNTSSDDVLVELMDGQPSD